MTDFYVPENNRAKMMVLDGQQRLQSLFIGLKGSYEGKELYFDITSGQLTAPEDIRYRFAFKNAAFSENQDLIGLITYTDPRGNSK